jgi:hypothetical protein
MKKHLPTVIGLVLIIVIMTAAFVSMAGQMYSR